jgi:hypothetical protein
VDASVTLHSNPGIWGLYQSWGGPLLVVVEEVVVGTSAPLAEEHFEPIVEDGATNLEEKVGALC